MTKHPDLFAALAAPFDPHEVKVRSQGGKQLHYVTARTVMNRLDDVVGPESWWDEYVPHENSVLCRLTVRLPDGATLTKSDAGGHAGMADAGDDDKSGYSDAFKRTAVKFGVGRYLYRDGVPTFVAARSDAPESAAIRERPLRDDEIPVPAVRNGHAPAQAPGDLGWVHNAPAAPTATVPVAPSVATHVNGKAPGGPPRTGKALFAWTKDQEQLHEVGLLKYLNQWAKLQDFPGRMVEWNDQQVKLGHAEALRKLATLPGESRD